MVQSTYIGNFLVARGALALIYAKKETPLSRVEKRCIDDKKHVIPRDPSSHAFFLFLFYLRAGEHGSSSGGGIHSTLASSGFLAAPNFYRTITKFGHQV
jgi:hypothetical protein